MVSKHKNANHDNSIKTILKLNKKQKLVALCVLIFLLFIIFLIYLSVCSQSKKLILNNQKIDVTVVSTSKDREKGLGGREKLGNNQGMLFVYDSSSQYCMWMKDMKFAIDIIWLDDNKKVTSIKQNATPKSYPETFCSDGDARYILELPADSVSRLNIKQGDQAKF